MKDSAVWIIEFLIFQMIGVGVAEIGEEEGEGRGEKIFLGFGGPMDYLLFSYRLCCL